MKSWPFLGVVVPTLDAAAGVPACLSSVRRWPGALDIVVVDGGSTDGTPDVAKALGARLMKSRRGRGVQLAAGAKAVRGDWLLFLHADTVLAPGWEQEAHRFMIPAGQEQEERAAAFRFALDDPRPAARRVERLVRWRCAALKLPYGDQGMLLPRLFYERLGGYRSGLPLMEDVDLVRRIGRRRLVMLNSPALTAAVRYRRDGYWRRPLRNLFCLALYFLGVPVTMIARLYPARAGKP
ncbi:MAG: glycosyl transferase family protein [Rhodospirillaceae bacterium]|nr:MAG: glycosyl transferase family protein [Rhodospirillaceae bacterium]